MASKVADFDKALHKNIETSLQEKRKTVVPTENVFGYKHGTKWFTRTSESNDVGEADEMQIHSIETSLSFKNIVDNDLASLPRHRDVIVDGMMKQFMQSIYQTIDDSTAKSGNVINAKGGKFKAEHFIELLEKIEFSVNRDGSISFPEIHVGPNFAEKMMEELQSQGPEFQKRVEEIQKRKSSAALEKEEERKSKFPKVRVNNQ